MLAQVTELIAYLSNNRSRLVNYGKRSRAGLPASTNTAESAVESVIGDRFKKNRKMRWTHKGANALLHIRVADLNGEIKQALMRRQWKRPRAANDDDLDWFDLDASGRPPDRFQPPVLAALRHSSSRPRKRSAMSYGFQGQDQTKACGVMGIPGQHGSAVAAWPGLSLVHHARSPATR